jgi:hypothetical protein
MNKYEQLSKEELLEIVKNAEEEMFNLLVENEIYKEAAFKAKKDFMLLKEEAEQKLNMANEMLQHYSQHFEEHEHEHEHEE